MLFVLLENRKLSASVNITSLKHATHTMLRISKNWDSIYHSRVTLLHDRSSTLGARTAKTVLTGVSGTIKLREWSDLVTFTH